MIGDVGGVPQLLLEVQPLPGAGKACSNRHTLHSLVIGYQAITVVQVNSSSRSNRAHFNNITVYY